MDYALSITIISIVSAILISFLTYKKERLDKSETEKTDSAYQKALSDAKDTIIKLNEKATGLALVNAEEEKKRAEYMIKKQAELIADQKKVIDLQLETEKKAKQLNGELTGGESFCEVWPLNYNDVSCDLIIYNHGHFPVYDVSVNFTEYDGVPPEADSAWKKISDYGEFLKNLTSFSIGQLNRNPNTKFLGKYNFKFSGFEKRFNILINQRNGLFTQQIVLRRKNNLWFLASRVIRIADNKVLSEMISKEFLYANESFSTIWHPF